MTPAYVVWSSRFRRLVGFNWFATVLRIGNTGFGEIVLPYERKENAGLPVSGHDQYTAKFTAQKSGEVFVYVNDAVIGIPGLFDYFYHIQQQGKGRSDASSFCRTNNALQAIVWRLDRQQRPIPFSISSRRTRA